MGRVKTGNIHVDAYSFYTRDINRGIEECKAQAPTVISLVCRYDIDRSLLVEAF